MSITLGPFFLHCQSPWFFPSPPHCQSPRVLPFSLSNTPVPLTPLPTLDHPSFTPPLLTVYHSGSSPFPSLSITTSSFTHLSTVNHPWSLHYPSHCLSLHIHSPILTTVNNPKSIPSLLVITPGPSPPLLSVNYHRSSHCSLSITPGPSPPYCQSLEVPPLLTVNHPMSLPSLLSITPVLPIQSSLSITSGLIPLLPTVNHPRSILPFPHWLSPQDLPFLTVNHPRSLPFTVSITRVRLFSPVNQEDHSPPYCQSPCDTSLPSPPSITRGPTLLTVNHPPFHTVSHPGFLTPYCQSHQVPPLFSVNHPGSLTSPPHCQSQHVPTIYTINHPVSLSF